MPEFPGLYLRSRIRERGGFGLTKYTPRYVLPAVSISSSGQSSLFAGRCSSGMSRSTYFRISYSFFVRLRGLPLMSW